ncbi:L-serine dehydratase [Candidatus Bipolaricaulis anaerobius]|uniref:L-serine dehydratase n=1 Tax=Candidatus Bipolaricaulis anaerobius TaxID=2026885 RepID=A0A2X3L300_9BACT|nr:L-serine ammonia-lyase [Candidatus Bipolaricaulis anaerobius]SQD93190.1 L-serine dehydratase [Candidatus Bipolaricaulis anaerobius]
MDVPSVFTILKVGIGPSSSHTMGPFFAARDFRGLVAAQGVAGGRLRAVLLGSLARTGRGHLTDAAVAAGLSGHDPDRDATRSLPDVLAAVRAAGEVGIAGRRFAFSPDEDIVFDLSDRELPHPNTLRFELLGEEGRVALTEEYRSLGGGAVAGGTFGPQSARGGRFTMTEVLAACRKREIDLAGFVRENERYLERTDDGVEAQLSALWAAMRGSVDRGLSTRGVLPGLLRLARRAPDIHDALQGREGRRRVLAREMDLASAYAIATAEENAAGGRVVTAPTCGAAGVLPAVLRTLQETLGLPDERVHDALLVAGLIGLAVATNASIAGAEVGCQGEVGTASAMAAAAACYLLGGDAEAQVDRAAETALEHYLGLTCDPVYGLVQIPCIERNAAAAVAALHAASLAVLCRGEDRISFDTAVAALAEIGRDMSPKYKETAQGGIAALFKEGPRDG